jgi:hypothetical protein
MGQSAVRDPHPAVRVNSEAGSFAGQEATVKDCGVAVAMLPG